MFFKVLLRLLIIQFVLMAIFTCSAEAKTVPEDFSNVQYFYVFGPAGNPLLGAEDSQMTLVIDVPANAEGDVSIRVYDPDTGGKKDFRTDPMNPWDTEVEFSVIGRDVITRKTFGKGLGDDKYVTFGPYPMTEGEKLEGFYRFKLVAKGIKGDDANLFKVDIYPDSAQCFSDNITFRLAKKKGAKMYFYPQVYAGTKYITVENYDVDRNGGEAILYDPKTRMWYKIKASESGKWVSTRVPIQAGSARRLKYVMTKGTQRRGHAGLVIKDDKNSSLPVYFQRRTPYVVSRRAEKAPVKRKKIVVTEKRIVPVKKIAPSKKCDTFTFDATKSYDVDNQPLTFRWDFGDGQTSSEPIVTHTYKKGGEYTVMLTVTDDSGLECDRGSITQAVRVNTPPKAEYAGKSQACVGDELVFDASPTIDDTSDNLSYFWDFGDNTSAEGKVVRKAYQKGGRYVVALKVDDNENTVCSVDTIKKTVRINTPPVADAGKDIEMCLSSFTEPYTVVFDGSGSYDEDKDDLRYVWDFGDGEKGEGRRVTRVYKRGGEYKATLTVNDGSASECSWSIDTIKVKLNRTPMPVAGDDKKACVGDTLVFDGSKSRTEDGETIRYLWDLGDGSSAEGANVSHAYTKGGRYNVKLTVDDGKGTRCSRASDTLLVEVNSGPVASLDGGGLVCVDEKTVFDGSASKDSDGDRLKYYWDFGDGTTYEGGSRVSYAYKKGGTYEVKVVVDDGRGFPCSRSSDSVQVRVNAPPVADAGPNLVCCLNEETVFDGSKSYDPNGDALRYRWDFGDGTTASGARVTHVYTKVGKYKVTLTVDDNSGTECSTATSSFIAVVNASPVPVIEIR